MSAICGGSTVFECNFLYMQSKRKHRALDDTDSEDAASQVFDCPSRIIDHGSVVEKASTISVSNRIISVKFSDNIALKLRHLNNSRQ